MGMLQGEGSVSKHTETVGKSFYDMVSALAGATGLSLTMNKKDVSGSATLTFDTPVGISVPLNPQVIKSFMSNGLGLLIHVAGDLYLIAYCLASNGVVSVYLIDGKGLTEEHLTKVVARSENLRAAVDTLRAAIVASFYWSGVSWSQLNLPR